MTCNFYTSQHASTLTHLTAASDKNVILRSYYGSSLGADSYILAQGSGAQETGLSVSCVESSSC